MMSNKLRGILKAILYCNLGVITIFVLTLMYEFVEAGLALKDIATVFRTKGNVLITGLVELFWATNIVIVPTIFLVVFYVVLFPNKPENAKKFMEIVDKKSVVDAKDAQRN